MPTTASLVLVNYTIPVIFTRIRPILNGVFYFRKGNKGRTSRITLRKKVLHPLQAGTWKENDKNLEEETPTE